jgi:CRT-like, chloroquine-resistance transporter-like
VYANAKGMGCIPGRFFALQYYRDTMNMENVLLMVYIALLVLFGAANSVTFRYTYAAWPTKYSVFVNQWTTLLYCVIGSLVLVYKFALTNDITPEMRKFPLHKFALMGGYDGSLFLFCFCRGFGG